MRLAREAIRQLEDYVCAHRAITTAAGIAGQAATAEAALQELRPTQPEILFTWIATEMPIMQNGELEHYSEAFQRAQLDQPWRRRARRNFARRSSTALRTRGRG
jgi:hypothetical protein